MSIEFRDLAARVAQDGRVTEEEILSLRRLGWGDGAIYREEAEAIVAINEQATGQSPEWADFFVEAIGTFVLENTPPRGYVSDEDADWLIATFDRDGKLESMAELECLVRILEKAQNVPDRLKHYALEQIERAVLTGNGPTRDGGALSDAHISDAEVKLLRRIVFSCGGHGPGAASRFDAEMLFRIKDKTLGADNSPQWKRLFVEGVGHYIKGFTSPSAQLSHARMLELEAFMADHKPNIGRVIGGMVNAAPRVARHAGAVFGRKEPSAPDHFARMGAGEQVTGDEKNWLDSQIDGDGEVDEFERALLEFLAEEAL